MYHRLPDPEDYESDIVPSAVGLYVEERTADYETFADALA